MCPGDYCYFDYPMAKGDMPEVNWGATTNQSQFKAAKVSSESAQTSYDLLSEQFKLGLKNIVELRTGKDNLLKAKQNELQAKYLAILNINMLKFYKEGHI